MEKNEAQISVISMFRKIVLHNKIINKTRLTKSQFEDNYAAAICKIELNPEELELLDTAQKMKFSIKDFFSKCDQIPRVCTDSMHWLSLFKENS